MKCPKDNRIRPIFIIRNDKREVVVSDGKGNAYECGDTPWIISEDYINKQNLINPMEYEFDRGLSGMDF